MKKLVEVEDQEGLERFLGERVTLFCMNYFYTGELVGINNTCVKLASASVVYETGPLDGKEWKDAQALPGDWYVQLSSIESFGRLK